MDEHTDHAGLDDAAARETVERTEKWFVARGTPRLIVGYDPSQYALTRALPVLALIFIVQTFRGIRRGWPALPLWVAVLVTVLTLVGTRAVLNYGTEGSLFRRVRSAGVLEETVFVTIPALVWFAGTGNIGGAVAVAALNIGLLLVSYLVFGRVVLRSWVRGLDRAARRVEDVVELGLRALPILLVVLLFFFVNSELWQVAHEIASGPYWTIVVAILLSVIAVIYWRVDRSLAGLESSMAAEEVESLCRDTPVAAVATDLAPSAVDSPPLTQRQRIEVGTVLITGIFTQVLLITLPVCVFFVGFGVLVVPLPVIELWTQEAVGSTLLSFSVFGAEVGVTVELLRVSGLLGAVAALHFAVNTAVDETYRDAFEERLLGEVRRLLAVRAVYLVLVQRVERDESAVDGSDPQRPPR